MKVGAISVLYHWLVKWGEIPSSTNWRCANCVFLLMSMRIVICTCHIWRVCVGGGGGKFLWGSIWMFWIPSFFVNWFQHSPPSPVPPQKNQIGRLTAQLLPYENQRIDMKLRKRKALKYVELFLILFFYLNQNPDYFNRFRRRSHSKMIICRAFEW